ncbi:hypothetical protein [Caldiplasma sukawensis]
MKVKFITQAEAESLLKEKEPKNQIEFNEYNYLIRVNGMDSKTAEASLKKIEEITGFSRDICVKIVDLRPKKVEEIMAILSGYKLTLSEEKIDQILSHFNSARA